MTSVELLCSICQDIIICNPIFTPCFHPYHSPCINEWLYINRNEDNIRCPTCKMNIVELLCAASYMEDPNIQQHYKNGDDVTHDEVRLDDDIFIPAGNESDSSDNEREDPLESKIDSAINSLTDLQNTIADLINTSENKEVENKESTWDRIEERRNRRARWGEVRQNNPSLFRPLDDIFITPSVPRIYLPPITVNLRDLELMMGESQIATQQEDIKAHICRRHWNWSGTTANISYVPIIPLTQRQYQELKFLDDRYLREHTIPMSDEYFNELMHPMHPILTDLFEHRKRDFRINVLKSIFETGILTIKQVWPSENHTTQVWPSYGSQYESSWRRVSENKQLDIHDRFGLMPTFTPPSGHANVSRLEQQMTMSHALEDAIVERVPRPLRDNTPLEFSIEPRPLRDNMTLELGMRNQLSVEQFKELVGQELFQPRILYPSTNNSELQLIPYEPPWTTRLTNQLLQNEHVGRELSRIIQSDFILLQCEMDAFYRHINAKLNRIDNKINRIEQTIKK